PGGEREDRPRLGHGSSADVVEHDARLPRRHADPLRLGLHALPVVCDRRHPPQRLLTCVCRSPACPRNVLVGANSPSLCPTICSLTNTGTCLRPSWTAIVCPTISGKIVEVRDQVRIIRFSPDAFIASIRLISRSSTKGPFLELRLTASPYLCVVRGRSACRTPCACAVCACRASARPKG